jgi:3'(2'), 5'-bisphosphate nucleotidase|tara:strand:+ start:124 stop:867 length:744 start_codon:yes stop_codon:yes gene_type:complete
LIEKIIRIAEMAGNIIMSFYREDQIDLSFKKDKSPLTAADIASNNFIINELESNFSYPILTEESPIPFKTRKSWSKFWLVDPLDGTKDFIEKNDEFTINIALIDEQRPILGVINIPALDLTYWAESGKGTYKNGRKVFNKSNRKNLIGTDSRFHSTNDTREFFKRNNIKKVVQYGSCLKLCKLAQGEIDIYPRLNGTKEWDTAAADIILNEAGCSLVSYPFRKKLVYNKKTFKNPFFIAYRNGIKWY